MTYPEHEKLAKIKPLSQAVGEFLEWLNENEYSICSLEVTGQNIMREDLYEWFPVSRSINQWLEEYFKIDGTKLEQENRQILAQIQSKIPFPGETA